MTLEGSISDWEVIDESEESFDETADEQTNGRCANVVVVGYGNNDCDDDENTGKLLSSTDPFSLAGTPRERSNLKDEEETRRQRNAVRMADLNTNATTEVDNETHDELAEIKELCAVQQEQLKRQAEEIRELKERLNERAMHSEERTRIIEAQSKRIGCLLRVVERLKSRESSKVFYQDEENAELQMGLEHLKVGTNNSHHRAPMFNTAPSQRRALIFECRKQPSDWETPIGEGA
ncbi:hypothetical protein, conserved [Trypanosoma brucei gambiense DAL972]|uniref:Uncharacterized protein n=2 Tax=Trypanosoma brucei TaxID=5691 RepID=C9ZXX3_TRYB9|nr:hypothetical protein, conserved [Trypanosoma brucei gambiense DAL972]RHW70439.1 hypothetical protein DPX39_090030900 [Trypanosoma brucei equiperdum]CBH14268.1 hypothetical protein, conserved [Trypanosoma brucei gambiense DAL972]|eukprot:XP_011776538.1 hypothetical protein, conserved [Trypanosoma brucei gambiense DAL972]